MLFRKAIGSTQTTSSQAGHVSALSQQLVTVAYRREAQAALAALMAGCGSLVLMLLVGSWWTQGYGLSYALAGSVGAIICCLVYAFYPRPPWDTDESGRVVAELSPRGPASFAKHWVFALPLSAAIALVLGLLLTGLYSTPDENGLYRIFQRRTLSGWGIEEGQVVDVQYNLSSNGPFPGWYYGVPVMICTILLIAIVFWALRRLANAPRPATADLFDADTLRRSLATRFIMTTSSAALAFEIAGLAAITGTVLRASHRETIPTADLNIAPISVPVEPGHTLALILSVASLVIAVLAIVLLTNTFATIRNMRSIGNRTGHKIHERVQ